MPEVGAVGPDRGLETMPGLLCTRAENCCTGQSVDRVSRVLGGGPEGNEDVWVSTGLEEGG